MLADFIMDVMDCLVDLRGESIITDEQFEVIQEAMDAMIAEWVKVAENIKKDANKYLKFMELLRNNEMSVVVGMLEEKYGKTTLFTSNNIFF